jgi:hypothetical protein
MRDSPDLLQALIGLHLPDQSRGNHNLIKILHSIQNSLLYSEYLSLYFLLCIDFSFMPRFDLPCNVVGFT